MTTYYVDTTVSGGLDNGSSWANAWNDLQAAIDKPLAAGDVVLCYSNGDTNKESPGATIDFDGTSGSNSSGGYIKFIGCSTNSGDGSPDGTKYVLDGGGILSPLVYMTSDYLWIENFRFTNASGDGVAAAVGSNADRWVWINCEFDNHGDCGWTCTGDTADYHLFVGCQFYSNTTHGCGSSAQYAWVVNCTFYQNGNHGYLAGNMYSNLFRCAFYDNADGLINASMSAWSYVDSCVFDGTNQSSESSVSMDGDQVLMLASRITNAAIGIQGNSNFATIGWCLFDGNTDDTAQDTLLFHLPFQSDLDLTSNKGVFSEGNPAGSTNKFDPDMDDGYNAASSQDYNLKASRTYNSDGTDTVELGVGS